MALSLFMVQLSHPYMTTWKILALTIWTFVSKVSLLFNMLSRFVIAFLQRGKHLLISWLQSLSIVILEPKKTISVTFLLLPHLFAMKWWGQMPRSYFFECWVSTSFSTLSFTFIKRLFSSSLSVISMVSSSYLRLLRNIDISPSNLDSSFCFFQASISHDVLCI